LTWNHHLGLSVSHSSEVSSLVARLLIEGNRVSIISHCYCHIGIFALLIEVVVGPSKRVVLLGWLLLRLLSPRDADGDSDGAANGRGNDGENGDQDEANDLLGLGGILNRVLVVALVAVVEVVAVAVVVDLLVGFRVVAGGVVEVGGPEVLGEGLVGLAVAEVLVVFRERVLLGRVALLVVVAVTSLVLVASHPVVVVGPALSGEAGLEMPPSRLCFRGLVLVLVCSDQGEDYEAREKERCK